MFARFSLSLRQSLRSFSSVKPPTPQEIDSRILNVIGSFSKVAGKKVELESSLSNDLMLDCLDKVEVLVAMEEEFGMEIPEDVSDGVEKVKDISNFFKRQAAQLH